MEKPSISTLAAVVSLAIASASTSAGVIGFLGKFEGINDTGGTAHGFELELEGLHFNDITDTLGGLSKGGAVLPAPAGNVIPAAPVPGLPPASPVVVVAQMQAPAPVI